jgi:hypothetical protein
VRLVLVAPAPVIDVPAGTAKCSVIRYALAPSTTSAVVAAGSAAFATAASAAGMLPL